MRGCGACIGYGYCCQVRRSLPMRMMSDASLVLSSPSPTPDVMELSKHIHRFRH